MKPVDPGQRLRPGAHPASVPGRAARRGPRLHADPSRRHTSVPPVDPRELPRWDCLPWWRKAMACCAQPTVFYSLMFAGIGGLFLVGSAVLDPKMAPIGLLLIAVAVAMDLVYLGLAYHAFSGRGKRPPCR